METKNRNRRNLSGDNRRRRQRIWDDVWAGTASREKERVNGAGQRGSGSSNNLITTARRLATDQRCGVRRSPVPSIRPAPSLSPLNEHFISFDKRAIYRPTMDGRTRGERRPPRPPLDIASWPFNRCRPTILYARVKPAKTKKNSYLQKIYIVLF